MTGHDPRDRHRERTWDERAGDRCPRCGRPYDQAERADVHHRDGNERNGSPGNRRKRCKKCHIAGEHGRPDDVETPRSPPGPSRKGPTGVSRRGPR